MRSKSVLIFFVILLLVLSIPVCAIDKTIDVGEVLYHQSFEDGLAIDRCGIRVGTAGSQNCMLKSSDEGLKIETYDSERTYILLPSFYVSETRTIEFSFKFDDKLSDNARLAVMLTCRGDEPTNITTLIFRAGGTVDGFTDPPEKVKTAISGGEMINVKIPLEGGILHEIVIGMNGEEYTLENREVTLVSVGSLGFVVRNANVTINDISVVNGVNYTVKKGFYAENSYSDDYEHDEYEESLETTDDGKSPNTGTNSVKLLLLPVGLGALGMYRTGRRTKIS